MGTWKAYVFSIIGVILVSGIITQIVSDLRYRKLIQLISGLALAVVVFEPVSTVDFSGIGDIGAENLSPDVYIDIGRQEALSHQSLCIKQACETYISNKAKELDSTVISEVYLDEQLKPYRVQMIGEIDLAQKTDLEQILEDDLGITKENQVWILNPEIDGS